MKKQRGRPRKVKTSNFIDECKPSKPKTGYHSFCFDERKRMAGSKMPNAKLVALIARRWKSLDSTTRSWYDVSARENYAQYERNLALWMKRKQAFQNQTQVTPNNKTLLDSSNHGIAFQNTGLRKPPTRRLCCTTRDSNQEQLPLSFSRNDSRNLKDIGQDVKVITSSITGNFLQDDGNRKLQKSEVKHPHNEETGQFTKVLDPCQREYACFSSWNKRTSDEISSVFQDDLSNEIVIEEEEGESILSEMTFDTEYGVTSCYQPMATKSSSSSLTSSSDMDTQQQRIFLSLLAAKSTMDDDFVDFVTNLQF